MDRISADKKLELKKQIRSRYQQNRYDMSNREQLLYGRTSAAAGSDPYGDGDMGSGEEMPLGMLPLRALFAAAVFLAIVICDKSGGKIVGISAEKCFQAIAADYESSINLWVDAAFQPENDHNETYPPAGSRP